MIEEKGYGIDFSMYINIIVTLYRNILSEKISNYFFSIILIVVLSSCSLDAKDIILPAELHNRILKSIDYIYTEQFELAFEETKKIIKKNPTHPAGYFFYAVALDAWMVYYQTDKKEEEFYRYCEETIKRAEELLQKEPNNVWAKFFIGGAYGYKGIYEARYERWITSFRHGWKGVTILTELLKTNPEIIDAKYGIGSYEYWRSAMMKVVWWMPGVGDNRQQGIEKLLEVSTKGLYSKVSASEALMNIYYNEQRYSDMLEIAEIMLKIYPNCLVFLWGKAKALFSLGRYEDANKTFRYILSKVEAESFDNHYNAILCHYWLAKIYYNSNDWQTTIAACNRMEYYRIEEKVKKRLEKYFEDAKDLRNKAKILFEQQAKKIK